MTVDVADASTSLWLKCVMGKLGKAGERDTCRPSTSVEADELSRTKTEKVPPVQILHT